MNAIQTRAIAPATMPRTVPPLTTVPGQIKTQADALWDSGPRIRALLKAIPKASTVPEIYALLQEAWALMRRDPTRADQTDFEVDQTVAAEAKLLNKLIRAKSQNLSDIDLKLRVLVDGENLPSNQEARLLRKVSQELHDASQPRQLRTIALTWREPEPSSAPCRLSAASDRPAPADADLIQQAARHIANMHAFNEHGASDNGPLWEAYEATRDALSVARPSTLAGLLAKAEAAKAEAVDLSGDEKSASSMAAIWAWDILNDLVRLAESGALSAPAPLHFDDPPCPVAKLASDFSDAVVARSGSLKWRKAQVTCP